MNILALSTPVAQIVADVFEFLPDDAAVPRSAQLMALASMALVFAVVMVIAVFIFLLVRHKSQQRERLITAALQNNQPEVAREIVQQKPILLRWLIIAFVAICALCVFVQLPEWLMALVVIGAIIFFRQWSPLVFGRSKDQKETSEKAASATPAAPAPQPVAPQTAESEAQSSDRKSTLSSWLLMF